MELEGTDRERMRGEETELCVKELRTAVCQ